jgi:hypothetical protein
LNATSIEDFSYGDVVYQFEKRFRGKKVNRFSSLQELPKTAISSSSNWQINPTQ